MTSHLWVLVIYIIAHYSMNGEDGSKEMEYNLLDTFNLSLGSGGHHLEHH